MEGSDCFPPWSTLGFVSPFHFSHPGENSCWIKPLFFCKAKTTSTLQPTCPALSPPPLEGDHRTQSRDTAGSPSSSYSWDILHGHKQWHNRKPPCGGRGSGNFQCVPGGGQAILTFALCPAPELQRPQERAGWESIGAVPSFPAGASDENSPGPGWPVWGSQDPSCKCRTWEGAAALFIVCLLSLVWLLKKEKHLENAPSWPRASVIY